MAEAVFIVRGSSPYALWYKVYASGDDDPDIYAGWLKEQLTKYGNVDPCDIVQRIDCVDSREVVRLYEEHINNTLFNRDPADRNRRYDWYMNRWNTVRWVQIKIGDIRDFVKSVAQKK
jgi:hypothetical protein